jgi:hypothetical protein
MALIRRWDLQNGAKVVFSDYNKAKWLAWMILLLTLHPHTIQPLPPAESITINQSPGVVLQLAQS